MTQEEKIIFNEKIKKGQLRVGFKHNTFEGKKHSKETIEKLKLTFESTQHQKGIKNSQFGTCWITNNIENRKIKKEQLSTWTEKGWLKGRKIKI